MYLNKEKTPNVLPSSPRYLLPSSPTRTDIQKIDSKAYFNDLEVIKNNSVKYGPGTKKSLGISVK